MGRVYHLDQNISIYMIDQRSKKWRLFVFVLICQCITLFRFVTIKKILMERNLGLLSFRRNIVKDHYHRYKRFTNSLPAPTKSVKVSTDVHYGNNSHSIGRGNQRRCGSCHKMKKLFCEKCCEKKSFPLS